MIKEKVKMLTANRFAKSVIELKLASDRLIFGRGEGAGVFTIKYQLLYLISSTVTARAATAALNAATEAAEILQLL